MKTGFCLTVAALLGSISAAAANCGDFPNRPIEVVVPYGAGGAVDITARTLAEAARKVRGWDLRVANRTGAGTVTGQEYLANQAPGDGYTIGIMPLMATVLNDVDERNGMEPGSLEVVQAIAFDPWLFVGMKGQTIESLVARGKEGEGVLRYAFSAGSEQGMMGDLFAAHHDVTLTHVPLAGGVARLGGLLNGSVDIAPSFVGEASQYLESGIMVPLGITNDTPYWAAPEIPALGSMGYPFAGNVWGSYRVILTPDDVTDEIKVCLSEAFAEIMTDPAGEETFLNQTIRPEPLDFEAAQATYARYQGVVQELLEAQSE